MRLHYSTVGMDEKRAAVAAVADLVRAMGDREGDQPAKCIDATSGSAPPSADGRSGKAVEREKGFEPSTSTLAIEPNQHQEP